MRFRSSFARVVTLRPTIETLGSRELLSHVAFPGQIWWYIAAGQSTLRRSDDTGVNGPDQRRRESLRRRLRAQGVCSRRGMRAGDILVSNFNNGSDQPGMGTTIVRVTPSGQQSLFYQGPPGVGLSGTLGVLKQGFVLVGYVPSADGTSLTVQPAGSSSSTVAARGGEPHRLLTAGWSMGNHDRR